MHYLLSLELSGVLRELGLGTGRRRGPLKLRLLGLRGRRSRHLGQVRQRVNVNRVGPLLSLVPHIHALLGGHQVHQLVAVFAHDYRSENKREFSPDNLIQIRSQSRC